MQKKKLISTDALKIQRLADTAAAILPQELSQEKLGQSTHLPGFPTYGAEILEYLLDTRETIISTARMCEEVSRRFREFEPLKFYEAVVWIRSKCYGGPPPAYSF